MYRMRDGLEVLLAHPGGPLFRKKDEGAWSIPKGELEPGEDLLSRPGGDSRKRPVEADRPADSVRPDQHKGGKIVHAWAVEGDCDPASLVSNTFTMEWPPHSGHQQEFRNRPPGVLRSPTARRKIKAAKDSLVVQLVRILRLRDA